MMTGASCARGDAQIKYFWSSMEGATVRIKFARKKENKRKRNDFGSTCRVHIFASLLFFFFFFFFFFCGELYYWLSFLFRSIKYVLISYSVRTYIHAKIDDSEKKKMPHYFLMHMLLPCVHYAILYTCCFRNASFVEEFVWAFGRGGSSAGWL